MQGVPSKHGPGCVAFISGELPRYGMSMHCLQGLKVPGGSMLSWQMGVMVTRSLQQAFTQMLANPDMQWVWIMGDDHTYPSDTVLKLLDHEKPVMAGLVLNRAPPFNTTVHVHDPGRSRVKLLPEMPTRGVYTLAENESCGDAGLLIRRHVLEALGPRGWFDYWTSGALAAEDQQFTMKLGKAGFPVNIDLDTHLGHITPVDIQPVVCNGKWNLRLIAGTAHVCDMEPMEPPASVAMPQGVAIEAPPAPSHLEPANDPPARLPGQLQAAE